MIRDFRVEDAPAVAGLAPEYQVVTPEGLLHMLATYPVRGHARAWIVEEDGRVAGFDG